MLVRQARRALPTEAELDAAAAAVTDPAAGFLAWGWAGNTQEQP